MIGVDVFVKGLYIGMVMDIDGYFLFILFFVVEFLIFSYIGYKCWEIFIVG